MKFFKLLSLLVIFITISTVSYSFENNTELQTETKTLLQGKGAAVNATMAKYTKSTAGKGAAVNATMTRYAKSTAGKGAAVNATMAKIDNEELSAKRMSGKRAVANAIMTRENNEVMALK
jgi:hypothetical protein